jgi:hypothetical protein
VTTERYAIHFSCPAEWVEQAQSDDLATSCLGVRLLIDHLHTLGLPAMETGAAYDALTSLELGFPVKAAS